MDADGRTGLAAALLLAALAVAWLTSPRPAAPAGRGRLALDGARRSIPLLRFPHNPPRLRLHRAGGRVGRRPIP
jgi:hypothetical protein